MILSHRLLMWIAIGSFVFMLLTSSFQAFLHYKRDINTLEETFVSIRDRNMPSLAASLWHLDMLQVQEQLNGIITSRDIVYAAIYETWDDNQSPLLQVGVRSPRNSAALKSYPLVFDDYGEIRRVGRLVLMADKTGIKMRFGREMIITLGMNALSTFLLVLMIFFIFTRVIAKRLVRVAQYVQTIDLETTNGTVELETEKTSSGEMDELDLVIQAINMMRRTLESDLEKRRRIEKGLVESRLKYAHLLDTIPHGVLEIDAEGRILFFNGAYERIYGYEKDELLGKSIFDLGMVEAGRLRRLLAHAVKRQPQPRSYESESRTKDGRTIFTRYDWDYKKDAEGRIIGFISVITDVTQQIQTRKSLKESEELHRSLFEHSPIPMFMQDFSPAKHRMDDLVRSGITDIQAYLEDHPDDVISLLRMIKNTRVNKEATTLYQAETKDLLLRGIDIFCPASGSGHYPAQLAAFYRGDPVYEGQGQNVTLSGQTIEVFVRKVLMPGHEEDLSLVLASVLDLTAIKQAEKEREALTVQLRQAQKMEAVGTLAGGIAHDFNNLLQAINGYTQIILLDKLENDPDYHNLTAIQKAGDRAALLVRQLLLFSRKVDIERRPIELNREIEHARKILERAIPKMIDIRFIPGGDLWSVEVDPMQIEQILLNLGSNAADAMPDGGTLVIETQNVVLDQQYAQTHLDAEAGEYVLLIVSDTGHGMDRNTVEHIFEPFYTTKEIGKGTGLGLASVYGIVKGHGACISCYSDPGRGTTFKIYFPASRKTNKTEHEDQADLFPRGAHETVLVVDDEESVRDFAAKILKRFGYSVEQAASGEEALEIIKGANHHIDLVLLDIGMPGMGGHKCLEEIMKIDPEAKVIVASGYSINGQAQNPLKQGASGFIGKPYQVADILRTIRDVLD